MKKENDILNNNPDLKQMPFSVPEGYFESFRIEKQAVSIKTDLWTRVAPYAAMAAVFVLLVTVGNFLLEKSTTEYIMTEEDYILFSDNAMNTITYEMVYGDHVAEAELMDEDIINYLIYTGVSAEEIEYYK